MIHQPDQARFRAVLPEDIDWKPFPGCRDTGEIPRVDGGKPAARCDTCQPFAAKPLKRQPSH